MRREKTPLTPLTPCEARPFLADGTYAGGLSSSPSWRSVGRKPSDS